uniref:Uncharacterized protein n=1 Tax=Anguilla anguilla TaxID=7936 RepID=A0A0E9TL66_ANGAN
MALLCRMCQYLEPQSRTEHYNKRCIGHTMHDT